MGVDYKSKQLIVVRRDLKMRKGKIAAQSGHACVEATLLALLRHGKLDDIYEEGGWIQMENPDESALSRWFNYGVAKVCVYVDSEEELLDIYQQGVDAGFVVALIRDAGKTEFHGEPTYTCLAFEPLAAEDIDPITGNLPLY